jgi:hypothetical protein
MCRVSVLRRRSASIRTVRWPALAAIAAKFAATVELPSSGRAEMNPSTAPRWPSNRAWVAILMPRRPSAKIPNGSEAAAWR